MHDARARTIDEGLPPGARVHEPLSSIPAPCSHSSPQLSSGPCRWSSPPPGPVFLLQTRVERLASPITTHVQRQHPEHKRAPWHETDPRIALQYREMDLHVPAPT